MTEHAAMLDEALRCQVAVDTRSGPLLFGSAYWSDGEALWLPLAAEGVEAAGLRQEPPCAVFVPGADGDAGLVLSGTARVYGVHDPVGLALHAPVLSAALVALAARNAAALVHFVTNDPRGAGRLLPPNLAAVRIAVHDQQWVPAPAPGPGLAPALPPVVPAEIRRTVAGRRRVVLATTGPAGVTVTPAAWDGDYRLTAPPGRDPVEGAAAAVSIEATPERGSPPAPPAGVSLLGEIGPGGVLHASRVRWWHGLDRGAADIAPASAGLRLPD